MKDLQILCHLGEWRVHPEANASSRQKKKQVKGTNRRTELLILYLFVGMSGYEAKRCRATRVICRSVQLFVWVGKRTMSISSCNLGRMYHFAISFRRGWLPGL